MYIRSFLVDTRKRDLTRTVQAPASTLLVILNIFILWMFSHLVSSVVRDAGIVALLPAPPVLDHHLPKKHVLGQHLDDCVLNK